ISCVAAGVYSAFAVLIRGSVKEAWIELQVGWHRLRAIGRQLATEDRVESRVTMPDRRRRLIPFGAMVAVGVMAALVWANWLVTALR
ncbi:MAG: hypothetical protein HY000_28500, partial [Planctomycetes bacterium]|nr:hypothetical protein [Planctomycetota bacterium]